MSGDKWGIGHELVPSLVVVRAQGFQCNGL